MSDEPMGQGVSPPGPRSTRQRLIAVGRVVFALAVLAAVVYATAVQWAGVQDYLHDLQWSVTLLSLCMVLIGTLTTTMAFRSALASVGHEVPLSTASQIFLIGLLAKYLPGSIWSYVLQAELGKRAKLPRSRPFVASLVLTGLSTTVALLFGLFGLPALFKLGHLAGYAVLILVPVSMVCAHPRVLTWLVGRGLAVLRRPPITRPFTWRDVSTVAGWCAIGWLAYGIHLWLLAGSDVTPGVDGVLKSTASMALGLTAGMIAFLLPSGIGAREAVIVTSLLPYTTPGRALGIALVSRLLFTGADLIAAGVAALSGIRLSRAPA
jgi:glycosyltransferase 2 family protein